MSSPLPLHEELPTDLDQSELTSRRAVAISRALRIAARRASGQNISRQFKLETIEDGRWFRRGILLSFVILVVVPIGLAALYLGVLASNQYVSEARFAVRDSESSPLETIGGLAGFSGLQRMQEALIISNYIRSRAMFEEIDKSIGLRDRYARPDADFLSRLAPDDPIEDMIYYWRWKVDVEVDINSGIVTLKVRAFTPEDALLVATEVIRHSERLVNELSERARRNALTAAGEELARSEQNLRAALSEMRDIRNAEGVLDAGKSAESITKLIAELRSRSFLLREDYEAANRTVSPSAPHMRILQSRIQALQSQIQELEGKIAGGKENAPLSTSQSHLQRGALNMKIAEDRYVLAAGKYEFARMETESQHAYLVTFVSPRLAEDSLYPRRLLFFVLVSLVVAAIWAGSVGIAVLIRNHAAI